MRAFQFISIIVFSVGLAVAAGQGADTRMQKELSALLVCGSLVAGTAVAAVADVQNYPSNTSK
jgi:uncharacterized membrane protein YadS